MSSGSRGGRGSVNNSTSKSGSTKTTAHPENASTNSTSAAEKAAKAAPTPEQIRLAQIIDTTQASQVDRALQEKIDRLMQITGKDSEEAHILLHDHANDLAAAVDALYEGGANTEAWHERTKKKKPKAKGELENNKENRRGGSAGANENNRERSGSRPRGGGRGGQSVRGGSRRDGDAAGGRGGPGRRGGGRGIANGGVPLGVGRGRGARSIRGGRGGAAGTVPHIPNDTFHTNRQNLATFDEAIDTWGGEAITAEQQPAGQDSYADPSAVGILEDWGEEWTGSLNETNVFVPSSVEPTPPPASDLTAIDAAKLVNSSPILQQQQNSYHHQQMDEQQQMGTVSVGAASPGTHQSYSAVANSTSAHSLSGPAGVLMPNSQHSTAAMDLAALLQQAAPQSQLTGLGTNSSLLANASANTNGSLSHLQQQTPNILGGINTNVGDVIKASSGTSNTAPVGGGGVSYSASGQTVVSSMSHYSAAPQHNSIFATSLQNSVSRSLGNSLSSSNSSGINSNNNSASTSKPGVIMPGMMPPVTGQTQRPKQTRPRPQPTSKIPQSAVEMPEDAMSAINMQLTGLKFGSEGFDFMAEPNKSMQTSSSMSMSNDASYPSPNVSSSSYSNSVAYPPPPSVNASGSSTPSYGGGVSAPSAAASAVSAASYVNSSYHNSGYAGSAQSSSPLNSYDRSTGNSQQHNSYNSSAGSNAMSSALAAADRSEASQKAGLSQNQNNSYSNTSQDVGSSNSASGSNSNGNNYNSSSGSGGPGSLSGGHSSSMSSNTGVTSSTNSGTGGVSSSSGANSYGSATAYSQQQPQSSSSATSGGGVSQQQQQYHHTSPTSASQSAASVQYQNNYNSSSHSSLSAISSKQLTPLKEPPQVSYSSESVGVSNNSSTNNSGSVSSTSNLSSLQAAAVAAAASQQQQVQQHTQHKPSPTSVPPPGVHQQQQHHQQQSSHLAQQHQAAAVAQQQMLVQQQQQQQHQFVNNNAALQAGTMPFFPSLQPQIYSYEELQLLQQRMPHMPQQVPSTLAGSRDASSLNAAAYSAADVAKFRSEQNSSPVPSAINTQGGHAGAYIANAGNAAAMHPMYMYHQNVAVPSSFPQYPPAIIQLPPNTGSSSSQFQPAPKLQYNAAAGPAYYDSQGGGDYKGGYGSSSQGQSKQGVGSNTGSMTSAVSDLPPYKNHLTKSYEKSGGFHTSTPPPFNLPGSAGAPYAHAQVFLPAMPQAQHHSTLMHHQLHQDGSSSGGQRGGSSGGQNKGASKPYQNQFWSNS